MPWLRSSLEDLNDAHRRSTAWARPRCVDRLVAGFMIRARIWRRHAEQVAHAGKVVDLGGAGEEAVVANAMETLSTPEQFCIGGPE